MDIVTYNDSPIWAIPSALNTCLNGYCNSEVFAGEPVYLDGDEVKAWRVNSANTVLSETPVSGTLHIYEDSEKTRELDSSDFEVTGRSVTLNRFDLPDVFCVYKYTSGESQVDKEELLEVLFGTPGDIVGVMLVDHKNEGGLDVPVAIAGYVGEESIKGYSPVIGRFMPGDIHII